MVQWVAGSADALHDFLLQAKDSQRSVSLCDIACSTTPVQQHAGRVLLTLPHGDTLLLARLLNTTLSETEKRSGDSSSKKGNGKLCVVFCHFKFMIDAYISVKVASQMPLATLTKAFT